MEFINTKNFNLINIFFILVCPYSFAIVRHEMLTLVEGMKETADIFTGKIASAAPDIGLNAAKELASAGVESSKIVVEGVNNAAKIGAQSVDKLAVAGQIIGVAAGVGICILAATQVYTVGKDIHSYLNPTDEEIDRQLKARESFEALHAKREFRKCIMQNHNHEKNESGHPVECEQLAKMFAAMSGKLALDEMTATFKSIYAK
ncbi:MAG TPA: hypothetical protein VHO47_02080 [Candidatus Babeliales bacterium]|nr:hypothetical protein [Candidatus Babeliales bacterium]